MKNYTKGDYIVKNIKIGSIVFVKNDQMCYKCRVSKTTDSSVIDLNLLNDQNEPVGSWKAFRKDIFETKKECEDAIETEVRNQTNAYLDEIKTLEDLIRFMYTHAISNGEYMDYPARQAAKIKAEQLLGIKL